MDKKDGVVMIFSDVYDSMLGFLKPEDALPWVENAFEEGGLCAQAYGEMRDAYERLCSRLGGMEEDADLNTIVDSMESIQKELCKRMFLCGMQALCFLGNA